MSNKVRWQKKVKKRLALMTPCKRKNSIPQKISKRSSVCEICGSDQDMSVHHIIPLRKGGQDLVSNAIRLCDNCHKIAHGKAAMPDTVPHMLLCHAVKHGVIGGNPRNTILSAVEGERS